MTIPLPNYKTRQRAPLKHLRRCLIHHTSSVSSMSEITDEEVDYGSSNIVENSSDINSDHAWSTQDGNSED